jgi:microsomal epoxide hydrolase
MPESYCGLEIDILISLLVRRKQEAWINSFPQFKTSVTDEDGSQYDIHFAALFSKKSDAIPILLLHGWPGSFLDFLPILDLLKNKYTAETLPYHIVVPSLPGWAYSSIPEKNVTIDDVSRVINLLASGLGFEKYIAHGGDIGCLVAKVLGGSYPACKGVTVSTPFLPRLHHLS